jgi:hypothetical protein
LSSRSIVGLFLSSRSLFVSGIVGLFLSLHEGWGSNVSSVECVLYPRSLFAVARGLGELMCC